MSKKKESSTNNSSWISLSVVFVVVMFIVLLASIVIVRYSIKKGVSTATDSFQEAYKESREDTYTKYKDMAYKMSESGYHVSNRVAISINAVKEKSELNVLRVNDVVYIITEKNETKSGTSSWLKVSGKGVFSVNMTAAEYVVDNTRRHVLVRVPRPVIDSSNISIDKTEILHFKENKWNSENSVKSGEDLARDQLGEAKQKIQEDFESNEQYAKLAESSTTSILEALIKGINPDIEDLNVEVEFY